MSRGLRTFAWLVPPTVVGAFLRLRALGDQVLGGDELHAVRAALGHSVLDNLTTYRNADPGLPLAAAYRLAMDAGVALSEWELRLPSLLAGTAAVALLPLLVVDRVGRREALLWGWLLAVAPLLVFYGRLVRPYALVVLLAWVAVLGCLRWLEQGSRAGAAAYGLCGGLAVWTQPLVLPFVAAPLALRLAEALPAPWRRRPPGRPRRPLRPLLVPGGALTVALLLFVGPSAASLAELAAQKSGEGEIGFHTVLGASRLFVGSARSWVALLVGALAVHGVWRLAHRRGSRRFTGYVAGLAVAQVAGVAVVSPLGIDRSPQLGRYLLVLLPALLLWLAVGTVRLGAGLRRERVVAGIASAALVATMVAAGPLAVAEPWDGSFAHHKDHMGYYSPPATLAPDDVPGLYRRLRATGGDGPIVEYPWHDHWVLSRTAYVFQRVHGRRVLVAPAEETFDDPRLALANIVAPDPESFLASGAAWLLVHADWVGEQGAVRGDRRSPGDFAHRQSMFGCVHRRAAEEMTARLRAAWGPPDLADAGVEAWRLDRVRTREAAR